MTTTRISTPSHAATTPVGIGFAWTACLGICLPLLLAPALWNGFPLVFHDTGGYIFSVLKLSPMPGRSLFYGLFLWAASLGWVTFWGPVVAQSALVLWLVRLMLRCHGLPAGPLAITAVCVGLGLGTGICWYASQLMPDVLVPMAVLAFWLLGFRWPQLGRGERAGLAALSMLGFLSHMSCLALGLGLLAIILMARAILPRLGWPLSVSVSVPALVLAASLALMPLVHLALLGKMSYTPGGAAFIFGRLVQDGIAQRWLAEHCPAPGIKLCDLQDRIPKTANDFLWAADSPFRDIGEWDGANAELGYLVGEAIKAYPGMFVWTALRSAVQQMAKVETGDGLDEYHFFSRWVFSGLLPGSAGPYNVARQQQQEITHATFGALNAVHVPLAYLSGLGLLVAAAWGLATRRHELAGLALFVLLALLGNALICGALSNPHDRYQSRMMWAATLVVGMAAATWKQNGAMKPPLG